MDIIDDLVVVLRVVLDYLGIDLEDVRSLLEEVNARRRERFYHIRQSISYSWNQVVDRRQCFNNRVNRMQADIRHKSLIRMIGSYLPLKSVKRVRIQSHLLQTRCQKFMYCSDSDNDSVISTTSIASTTDDDIVWVEEEIGENCVRVRAEKRRNFEDCDEFDDLDAGLFIARPSLSPMSSTMISSTSSVFQNPDQSQKLSVMEEELNNLRKQIAMLVEAQEQINKSQIQEVVTSLQPLCPKAPPLPPPLPVKQQTPPDNKEETEIKTAVIQRSHINQGETPDAQKLQPSLTEVLKGIGNVKLRSIQRSPGGTPLKPKPRKRDSTSDPASVIAEALKKKFANQFAHSPDVDKENDSQCFSSPDTNSFGYGNKRIKRRSIFSEDKCRLSGPLRL